MDSIKSLQTSVDAKIKKTKTVAKSSAIGAAVGSALTAGAIGYVAASNAVSDKKKKSKK